MNENTKKHVIGITLIITLIAFSFIMLFAFLVTAGYPTYLSDVGNQQACAEQFGENATYVGKTGAGQTTQRGALCQTNDGLRIIESETAPMNWGTFAGYLNAVFDGEY